MMRYIASKDNLKIIMNMLRDKSPNIQFEAFHVFKVFVANPNKPPDIALVLYKNKDKLIAFLNNFYSDKEEDVAQFNEEKCLLIETLTHLTKPVPIMVPKVKINIVDSSNSDKNSVDINNNQSCNIDTAMLNDIPESDNITDKKNLQKYLD